jgi:hypothetical protein
MSLARKRNRADMRTCRLMRLHFRAIARVAGSNREFAIRFGSQFGPLVEPMRVWCRFAADFIVDKLWRNPEMLWPLTCLPIAMSSHKEELVVKQLQELKSLETELHTKWKRLKGAGTGMRASFVSSLRELQTRTQQLELLLDSSQQRVL